MDYAKHHDTPTERLIWNTLLLHTNKPRTGPEIHDLLYGRGHWRCVEDSLRSLVRKDMLIRHKDGRRWVYQQNVEDPDYKRVQRWENIKLHFYGTWLDKACAENRDIEQELIDLWVATGNPNTCERLYQLSQDWLSEVKAVFDELL